MKLATTIAEFNEVRSKFSGSVGFVPTMGALHEGHLSLVRQARIDNDFVVVSIFVNPVQFGPSEDFTSYPRSPDNDTALLRSHEVDLLFVPQLSEIYPTSFNNWIDPGPIAQKLEGFCRPGHFLGVATVVARLFSIVIPKRAYFGQKDGQQVSVIQQMIRSLELNIEIIPVSTVRSSDGLALSSRNVYLSPPQRIAASVLYRALDQAFQLWKNGERDGKTLKKEINNVLQAEPLVEVIDYISVADKVTLEEVDTIDKPVMASCAILIGETRLIDNVLLENCEGRVDTPLPQSYNSPS